MRALVGGMVPPQTFCPLSVSVNARTVTQIVPDSVLYYVSAYKYLYCLNFGKSFHVRDSPAVMTCTPSPIGTVALAGARPGPRSSTWAEGLTSSLEAGALALGRVQGERMP